MKNKIKVIRKKDASTGFTKRNKLLSIGLVLLLLLLQSSCWDKVEVEQLAIVMAIAVDKGENGLVRTTVQVINPKGIAGGTGKNMAGGGGGGQNQAYRNISDHGRTIFEAVRGMQSNIPRELYFSHNQVVIISEELAREGVAKLMDFFDRNPQIRRNNWLLISKRDASQYEIINAPNPLEIVPAQRIVGIIKEKERSTAYAINQLGDFLELLSCRGVDAYTAGIGLSPNMAVAESDQNKNTGSAGESLREDVNVTQTAVFRDDRLVGWLNERESRGLLWIKGRMSNASVTVEYDQKHGNVSVEALQGKGKIKPVVTREGQIIMNIDVKVKGSVSEVDTFIDLSKPENLSRVEKKLAQEIKEDIRLALEKVQREYKADVFGFGENLYRHYPGYWHQVANRWGEIYPEIEVVINVKAEIPRTGLVSKPIEMAK
nr:Ger(x)C family spore germination protein [Desulforadius tongensis]